MCSGCALDFANTFGQSLRESSGGLKADKMWLKTNLVCIHGFHELLVGYLNRYTYRIEKFIFSNQFLVGTIDQ